MTRSELDPLLTNESNAVDWKATGNPEKIAKTLAAYANDYEQVGSGLVVCGVEESKNPQDGTKAVVAGLARATIEELQNRVFELARSLVHPPIAPRFDRVAVGNGKEVLLVWVAASSDIHTFKSEVVIRLGDKVTKATVSQIAELALRKQHLDWLAQPCPGATRDDLDLFVLEDLARRLRASGTPSTFLDPGARIIGSALPLTSQVETPTHKLVVPNRFAVLLVGSQPNRFLPGAFISLTRFRGITRADEIFVSSDVFGPIPYLVEKLMGVLETEAAFITDKSQDFQSGRQNIRRYSMQALQEILVNSLVHRDYRSDLSTKVNIFSDRIEFENPSGAPMGVTLDELKKGTTRWRNPSLARYLFELGLAQERGTGIPRAVQETTALAGSEPTFEVGDWFKVTVPAYTPPALRLEGEPVNPGSGVLVISIGYGTIELEIIRRSNAAFRDLREDRLRTYNHSGVVVGEQWQVVLRDLRAWLRGCFELPSFKELHLFYRGPVAFGPLIGAIASGRKPLVVYYFDEDEGVYRSAYRIDRKLLQAE
jgi:ATP-dependent DNA helicase RecG